MRSWRPLLSSLLALACAAPALRAQPADAAARVTALADEYVAAFLSAFPEEAEISGFSVDRHDGLTDNGPAALQAWRAREDAWAEALAAIDGASLRGRPEWITYGMLRERLQAAQGARVCRTELWPVSQMSGWQVNLSVLGPLQPVGTPVLREQALARWRRIPAYVDNEIAWLREGVRAGYTTPKPNVRLVIAQLDAVLAAPPEQSPLYGPARRDSAPEFQAAWQALVADALLPAVRRYRDYLADEYLPAARETLGVGALPDGRACYQALFRSFTTLDRAPEETFRLGQARVAQNQDEVREIGRRAWGTTDLDSIRVRARGEMFTDREALLAFSRDAVERGRAQVPRWFRTVPWAPVVVEPHPAFLEATASDSTSRPRKTAAAPRSTASTWAPRAKRRARAPRSPRSTRRGPATTCRSPWRRSFPARTPCRGWWGAAATWRGGRATPRRWRRRWGCTRARRRGWTAGCGPRGGWWWTPASTCSGGRGSRRWSTSSPLAALTGRSARRWWTASSCGPAS